MGPFRRSDSRGGGGGSTVIDHGVGKCSVRSGMTRVINERGRFGGDIRSERQVAYGGCTRSIACANPSQFTVWQLKAGSRDTFAIPINGNHFDS